MFDRFTPEARRSLELASQLASDRGDAAVAPDHVLVALADGGSGLAAALLGEAGLGRDAVEAAMGPGGGGAGAQTPPFTAATKKALELALRESLNLAHGHIGSGHLLLGLLRLGEGLPAELLAEHGITLEAARAAVGERSEGARLGGRRRPRRTGRVFEAPTPHERAKAAAAAEPPTDDDLVHLANADGSRLQKALAALGVTPDALQAALADVAAEPDDGPVVLELGAGATLRFERGARAAELRALLRAAEHVAVEEEPDGALRLEVPELGDAVWATIQGWLAA